MVSRQGGQVQAPQYSYTPAPNNPPCHAGTGPSFFQGASTALPSVLTSRDWLPTKTFGHAYKAPHPSTEQQHAWKLSLARTVPGSAI